MRLVLILTMVFFSAASFAGDKIGNGGGLWACYSASGELRQATLVDLYEAQAEFQLPLMNSAETDPLQIAAGRSELVRGLKKGKVLLQTLNEVLQNTKYVKGELALVNDAYYRLIPPASSCEGSWKYTQLANFTFFGSVLIRDDLWGNDKVPALDKAALIWHETIYRWLRLEQGDRDSVRTRSAVGILFSDLPAVEIQTRLDSILDLQHPTPPPGVFHGN